MIMCRVIAVSKGKAAFAYMALTKEVLKEV